MVCTWGGLMSPGRRWETQGGGPSSLVLVSTDPGEEEELLGEQKRESHGTGVSPTVREEAAQEESVFSRVICCWWRGKMRTENYPFLLATWRSLVLWPRTVFLEGCGQEPDCRGMKVNRRQETGMEHVERFCIYKSYIIFFL